MNAHFIVWDRGMHRKQTFVELAGFHRYPALHENLQNGQSLMTSCITSVLDFQALAFVNDSADSHCVWTAPIISSVI
jgi:hypothetical protein